MDGNTALVSKFLFLIMVFVIHEIFTESELVEIAESIPDSIKIPASILKLSSTAIGQGKQRCIIMTVHVQ